MPLEIVRASAGASSFALGALGAAGFSLADLLAAEARAGIRSSRKAVINVHLDGGPPHLDMIDLKPDAPLQVRGEFKPISTAIPGFSICELMPRLAQSAGKVAFIRSLVGSEGAHNAFQVQSGYDEKSLAAIGGRPAMGSVIARLQGSPSDTVPPFVDLMQGRPLVRKQRRRGSWRVRRTVRFGRHLVDVQPHARAGDGKRTERSEPTTQRS